MTRKQMAHLIRWLSAMYITEQWTPTVEEGGKRGLYARTRQVVVFDRALSRADI